jgi:hypothetical protein
MDVDFPDKFLPAIRIVVINLVWILPLIAIERAADGHPVTAVVLGIPTFAAVVIAVKWAQLGEIINTRGRTLGFMLIGAGFLGCLLLGGAGIYLVARSSASRSCRLWT